MSRSWSTLPFILFTLVAGGCGQARYDVSGQVLLDDGTPLEAVRITFTGGHETVLTDEAGLWRKPGLSGKVTIEPEHETISFSPSSLEVKASREHAVFTGLPGYSVSFYDGVRVLDAAEQLNIAELTESRIVFHEHSPFVASLREGQVLVGRFLDSEPLEEDAYSPVPLEGLLVRITEIEPDGISFSVTPALLDEVIRQGTLTFGTRVSRPDQAQLLSLAPGVRILSADPLEKKFEIEVTFPHNIKASGSLEVGMDMDLAGGASFDEGLDDFEMSITPRLAVELTFEAKYEGSIDAEHTLFTYSLPFAIMLFPGVTILPSIEFVVGADASLEAGLVTRLAYERGLKAGIRYDSSDGWQTIQDWIGDGVSVQEPLLYGDAEAEIYAGLRFSALVHGALGLYVGPFLYGDTEASVSIGGGSAWEWEYRLGAGMKLLTGASLRVLRIASISYDFPPVRLFHTDFAYGVSGRVIDFASYGIMETEVHFSSGGVSRLLNDLGYWTKHLLSDTVTVTPKADGWEFDPTYDTVDGPASDLVFIGTYLLGGYVLDEESNPIAQVPIYFVSPSGSKPVTTEADGSWLQRGFWQKTTVTPTLEGYTFSPESLVLEGPDRQLEFVGTYEVSGVVLDELGEAMGDVTLLFGGAAPAVVSGANGRWRQEGLSGTVTITPAKDDLVFEPANAIVTGPVRDLVFQTGLYEIEGFVRDETGTGVPNVYISFSGDSNPGMVATNMNGHYRRDKLYGTVVVTPSMSEWGFRPTSITVDAASSAVSFEGFEDLCEGRYGRCIGSLMQYCEEGEWFDNGDCADDPNYPVCNEGFCVTCRVGAYRCVEEFPGMGKGLVSQKCVEHSSNWTYWQMAEDCVKAEKICTDGHCLDRVCCGFPLDGSPAWSVVEPTSCDMQKTHFPPIHCDNLHCCRPESQLPYQVKPHFRCRDSADAPIYPLETCDELVCCRLTDEERASYHAIPGELCAGENRSSADMTKCEDYLEQKAGLPNHIGEIPGYPDSFLALWPERLWQETLAPIMIRRFYVHGVKWGPDEGRHNLSYAQQIGVGYELGEGSWSTTGLGCCGPIQECGFMSCNKLGTRWYAGWDYSSWMPDPYHDTEIGDHTHRTSQIEITLDGNLSEGYDAQVALKVQYGTVDWVTNPVTGMSEPVYVFGPTVRHSLSPRLEPVYRIYAHQGNCNVWNQWTTIDVDREPVYIPMSQGMTTHYPKDSRVEITVPLQAGRHFRSMYDLHTGERHYTNPVIIESLERNYWLIATCWH